MVASLQQSRPTCLVLTTAMHIYYWLLGSQNAVAASVRVSSLVMSDSCNGYTFMLVYVLLKWLAAVAQEVVSATRHQEVVSASVCPGRAPPTPDT